MKSYTKKDICYALERVGVKQGDLVFITIRLFSIGKLEGCESKKEFNQTYLNAIFDVIGKKGTLVVPTYSQQVGRFGLPYIHEETPTLAGVFPEFIRQHPGSIRSFHPVFSLTALGYHAKEICGNVSTNGFGMGSAYDNLFKHGGHSISIGFDYESGHIVTGTHYIECSYAVPYYYNKILKVDVYKDSKRCDKVFTLNVRYVDFDIKHNFLGYIKALCKKKLLKSYSIGESILYSSRLEKQLNVGYELLNENVYAFLEHSPSWKEGVIPFDGPKERLDNQELKEINWHGFRLQSWGKLWK